MVTSCVASLSVATAFLLGYCYYAVRAIGHIPASISQSFYEIPEDSRWAWLCTLGFSGIALAMCGVYLPMTGIFQWPLLQLSGAFICMVMGASFFHTRGVGFFHYVGAIVGYAGAIVSLGLCYGEWVMTGAMAVSAVAVVVLMRGSKSRTWWLEIVLAVELVVYLFILVLSR